MRVIRYAALAAALLAGCNGSFEPYQCATSRQVVASQRVDFETTCAGAPCDALVVGTATIVPSLLPGDHALSIGASSAVTWTWDVAGGGGHTAIGLNYRCDAGGSLRLLGDRAPLAGLAGIDPGATPTWQHGAWTLAAGADTFGTRGAAQAGHYAATVALRNVGSAPCVVDQIVYAETAEVCVSSAPCGVRYGDSALQCGVVCVDPSVDPNNCGACGQVCPSGQHCMGGVCASPSLCLAGCIARVCGPDYCGTGSCGVCGSGERCTVGGLCVSGSEVDGGATAADGGATFDAGMD